MIMIMIAAQRRKVLTTTAVSFATTNRALDTTGRESLKLTMLRTRRFWWAVKLVRMMNVHHQPTVACQKQTVFGTLSSLPSRGGEGEGGERAGDVKAFGVSSKRRAAASEGGLPDVHSRM